MRCIACETDNSPKAKFCKGCGMALAAPPGAYSKESLRRCGACKVVVARDANFCSSCGHDLGAVPLPIDVGPSERRSARRRSTFVSMGFGAMAVVVAALYVAYIGGSRPRMQAALAHGMLPSAHAVNVSAETPAPKRWLVALRSDLQRCESGAWYSRPICSQRAVSKHCGPNHWGTVPECQRNDEEVE
jgi:hypothetical protein